MFDQRTTFTGRLTDTVDLMIDFATLGEYGLEPVGRARPGCAESTSALRTRTEARSSQCDLLAESGLCKPPSARVAALQKLRNGR